MDEDILKPRFLLTKGCKDLIDVLDLDKRTKKKAEISQKIDSEIPKGLPESIQLPESVIVRDLAAALNLPGYHIIRWLMNIHILASANTTIDYDVAERLCLFYGVKVTKAV